jgi:hypothetical protein
MEKGENMTEVAIENKKPVDPFVTEQKSKSMYRLFGIILLLLIVLIIITLFKYPSLLTGVTGIFVPVSLFIVLLTAFYFFIFSLKS